MNESVTIGLDVGGTKIAGGLVTGANELLARTQKPTEVGGHRDPGLRVTRQVAEELARMAVERELTVDGIGAGFPEYVDPDGRLASHEVLEWTLQPEDLLADIAPATADSDVRCAALGEGACGAARDLDSYALVIVGTGLSYALVERGRARPGFRGEAIGLGESEVSKSVDPTTSLSLERFASGQGIRERYAAATGEELQSAAAVFDLAGRGDTLAASIVDSAAQAVGTCLATLASILDPGAFVLGGGVASSGDRWRAMVKSAYDDHASARPAPPALSWATLGSDAGIIGAAISHRLNQPARHGDGE